jgi:hypothetical protein
MALGRSLISSVVILCGLLLPGCMTSNDAVYKHPDTGEVLECEETNTGGLRAIVEKSYYTICKNSPKSEDMYGTGQANARPPRRLRPKQQHRDRLLVKRLPGYRVITAG